MSRTNRSYESALASDIFEKFAQESTLKNILSRFQELLDVLEIEPCVFPQFFPYIKENLYSKECQELLGKFERRVASKSYGKGYLCKDQTVVVIGAGPAGLRTAIECQLLGAKVIVIESRVDFNRANVLHLWPFVITDLKELGAKKFYGKFCSGAIDHIAISQLQMILIKIALLLGVQFHFGTNFKDMTFDPSSNTWGITTEPQIELDSPPTVVIGAAGGRSSLFDGHFRRKTLRAKLAIGITANFVNRRTEAEVKVQEIAGLSAIYRQSFFAAMAKESAIDLENIVYYKDESHYFVMTAKKQSLLYRGVLKNDYSDTDKLLAPENIDKNELYVYAEDVARICTNEAFPLEFTTNSKKKPDVAIFDFTYIYQSENACKILERNGVKVMLGLVGDALLEPFWPTGTGCARGFLSGMDAAWSVRTWSTSGFNDLETLAERESIFRILAQTSPENLKKDFGAYTVDPNSRYCYVNTNAVTTDQVGSLLEIDGVLGRPKEVKEPTKSKKEAGISKMDLEIWLRNRVGRFGVRVLGLEDALRKGEALVALLHLFRHDLMPEYPLPDELFEGFSSDSWPTYKNQLAFDLIAEHYGLCGTVNGFQSVHETSKHLPDLLEYLAKVKECFDKDKCRGSVQTSAPKPVPSTETPKRTPQRTGGGLQKSSTFLRRSEPATPQRSNSFAVEMRRQRAEEAERKKQEALRLVGQLKDKQSDMRQAKWEVNRGRIADRVLKLKESSQVPPGDDGKYSSKEGDEFFNHYNMRLYRATVPTVGERSQALAEKLDTSHSKPKVLVCSADKFSDWIKPKEKPPPKPLAPPPGPSPAPLGTKAKPRIGKLSNPKAMEENIYGSTSRKVRVDLFPGAKVPEVRRQSSRPSYGEVVDPEEESRKWEERKLQRRQSQVEEVQELDSLLNASYELNEEELNHLIGWTESFA